MGRYTILTKKVKPSQRYDENLLEVREPFFQVLDKERDRYRIKVVFPLYKNGKKLPCSRGAIISFKPENFFITGSTGEYLEIALMEEFQ